MQAGQTLYAGKEVEQIEDSLITGVLRDRLESVSIGGTQQGLSSLLWLNVFSHCPWLSLTKLSFSNHLVLSKSSSRKHVQYVGHFTQKALWR